MPEYNKKVNDQSYCPSCNNWPNYPRSDKWGPGYGPGYGSGPWGPGYGPGKRPWGSDPWGSGYGGSYKRPWGSGPWGPGSGRW